MLGGKLFICSLTSWRARINIVGNTIQSLLDNTFKPDKIVLNLSKQEFPGMDNELPQSLKDLAMHSPLEIYWVEGNSKAFKKLIPTLDRYRDAIVMTNDDDIIYPKDFLEEMTSHYSFKAPLTPNGGRQWGSGYGSIYEYRFFGKYLHAFDRQEVWNTNEDDIAYGVLLLLNGFRFDWYGYNFKKIHQVDERNGLFANHQYDSERNERWFDRYVQRRFNVSFGWMRDAIERGVHYDLIDKEPISKDTLLQIHLGRPQLLTTEDKTNTQPIPEAVLDYSEPVSRLTVVTTRKKQPAPEPEAKTEDKTDIKSPHDIIRDQKKAKFLGEVKFLEKKGKKTFKKFINRH